VPDLDAAVSCHRIENDFSEHLTRWGTFL
jgi:hypothetical protein